MAIKKKVRPKSKREFQQKCADRRERKETEERRNDMISEIEMTMRPELRQKGLMTFKSIYRLNKWKLGKFSLEILPKWHISCTCFYCNGRPLFTVFHLTF